jgi:Acetyltransferase (GNAT) domain
VSAWTEEAIVAAAAAWRWVPPDAHQVLSPEYQLVRYPEHYLTNQVEVLWSLSERPVGELIDEVGQYVRVWGHSEVHWDVTAATRPQDTEAELRRRGAPLTETTQVLAYDLTAGLPELAEPPGVTSEVASDEASVRAGQIVYREVWGNPKPPTDAEVELALAETQRQLADWSEFRVVSYLNGEPASFGGCTLVDGVARLWGAGTRAALRGHGAYRVVLARRMAVAREHGATLALVKGRVETSAPILRRAGFLTYGEERTYLVAV